MNHSTGAVSLTDSETMEPNNTMIPIQLFLTSDIIECLVFLENLK